MSIYELVCSVPAHRKLEILRIARGWTQDEAAQKCGTTRKNYYLWASGKTSPRGNSRRAIASAFGVPENDIFGTETVKGL